MCTKRWVSLHDGGFVQHTAAGCAWAQRLNVRSERLHMYLPLTLGRVTVYLHPSMYRSVVRTPACLTKAKKVAGKEALPPRQPLNAR